MKATYDVSFYKNPNHFLLFSVKHQLTSIILLKLKIITKAYQP